MKFSQVGLKMTPTMLPKVLEEILKNEKLVSQIRDSKFQVLFPFLFIEK